MILIYLSAMSGKRYGDAAVVVQVQVQSCAREKKRIYRYGKGSYDFAKLKSLIRLLEEMRLFDEADVSIFLDSPGLFEEWMKIHDENNENVRFYSLWRRFLEQMLNFKYLPHIVNTGILSPSMRDELKLYLLERQERRKMEEMKKNEN